MIVEGLFSTSLTIIQRIKKCFFLCFLTLLKRNAFHMTFSNDICPCSKIRDNAVISLFYFDRPFILRDTFILHPKSASLDKSNLRFQFQPDCAELVSK